MEVLAWEEVACKIITMFHPLEKKQICLSLVFVFVGENMSLNNNYSAIKHWYTVETELVITVVFKWIGKKLFSQCEIINEWSTL